MHGGGHGGWLFAGLVFLGSQSGNSQLLELSFRSVVPGSDSQAMHQCTVRNEALVDSLAPTQDAIVFEDPPGGTRDSRYYGSEATVCACVRSTQGTVRRAWQRKALCRSDYFATH